MQTIWLSPTGIVTGDSTLQISYPSISHPGTVITCTSPGDLKWVSIGLALPQDTTIEEITVCYQLSNARSFISQIRLVEISTPNQGLVRHDDPKDLTSTIPTCYSSKVAGFTPSASVILELRLDFNDTADEISLGAIGIGFQFRADYCIGSIADLRTLPAGSVPCLTLLGYYAPGDGGGGSFAWTTDTSTPDDGGTVIVPTAKPRSGCWKRLFSGPLNVRWFGAKGNALYYDFDLTTSNGKWFADSGLLIEATDDAPAIFAAMATAAALVAGSSNSSSVLIPQGSYYIKTPTLAEFTFFQPTSNVSILGVGDSSVLRVAPNLNSSLGDFNVFFTTLPISNVTFSNIRIDANGPFNTNPGQRHNFLIGLASSSVANVHIASCGFERHNGWNTVAVGDYLNGSLATNVRVNDCFWLEMGDDATLTDHQALWVQGEGVLIANNIFYNDPVTNKVSRIKGGCIEVHGQNISLSGNRIRNYGNGIAVSIGLGCDTYNVAIVGNNLSDVSIGVQLYESAPGFEDQALHDICIWNNVLSIRNNGSDLESGVQIAGGYAGQKGIDRLLIANNDFVYNKVPGWAEHQPYGISLQGNLTSCSIANNRIDGFTFGGIQIEPDAYPVGSNFCHDLKIACNHLTNCGTGGNFTAIAIETTSGESSASVQRADIHGNTLVDNQPIPTTQFGIKMFPAADGIQITDNIFRGITTPVLLVSGGLSITNAEVDFVATIEVTSASDTALLGGGTSRVFATTVSVPGATENSYVTVVPPTQQAGLLFSGTILGGDIGIIVATNTSAGPLSPPAGPYTLGVRRIS